jgi:hypothetical protein
VRWTDATSRFAALFEALAIEWLKAASQKAVAGLLKLSWDEIHSIMERAVKRGVPTLERNSLMRSHGGVWAVRRVVETSCFRRAPYRRRASIKSDRINHLCPQWRQRRLLLLAADEHNVEDLPIPLFRS